MKYPTTLKIILLKTLFCCKVSMSLLLRRDFAEFDLNKDNQIDFQDLLKPWEDMLQAVEPTLDVEALAGRFLTWPWWATNLFDMFPPVRRWASQRRFPLQRWWLGHTPWTWSMHVDAKKGSCFDLPKTGLNVELLLSFSRSRIQIARKRVLWLCLLGLPKHRDCPEIVTVTHHYFLFVYLHL